MFDTIQDARCWWENSGYYPMEWPEDFNEYAMIDELWQRAENEQDADNIVTKRLGFDESDIRGMRR